nr:hypothetical protein CPGR_05598 [Mycolicibacter nonchromogenicus]
MNSPSATARSNAATAGRSAPGYCRVTESKVTDAMDSPDYRPPKPVAAIPLTKARWAIA